MSPLASVQKGPFATDLDALFALVARKLVTNPRDRVAPSDVQTVAASNAYDKNAQAAYDAGDDIYVILVDSILILIMVDYESAVVMVLILLAYQDLLEDCIFIANKIAAEADAFCSELPEFLSDKDLAASDRESWIEVYIKEAQTQMDRAGAMSERIFLILFWFTYVWDYALNVRRSSSSVGQEVDASPDAREGDNRWGYQAERGLTILLGPIRRMCMAKLPATDVDVARTQPIQIEYELLARQMQAAVNEFNTTWLITRTEAVKAETALGVAITLVDYPEYMKIPLENAAKYNAEISAYLKPYAKQIQNLLYKVG